MTDTLPISQLPNGQAIQAVSAGATVPINRASIGLSEPRDAQFITVSASAAYFENLTTPSGRFTTVSAGTGYFNTVISATGNFAVVSAPIGRFTTVSADVIYTNSLIASAATYTLVSAPTINANVANLTTINSTTINATTVSAPTGNFGTGNFTTVSAGTGNIATLNSTNVNGTTGTFTTVTAGTANVGTVNATTVTAATGNFTTGNFTTINAATVSGATANFNVGNFATVSASAGRFAVVSAATAILPSSGGTGRASLTSKNLLIGAGTAALTFLAPGASGTVVGSNGTDWVAVSAGGGAGGAMVLLSTQTASSSANINFNSTFITSTYKNYLITWKNVAPANDGSQFLLRVSEDNGSTIKTTSGDYANLQSGNNTNTPTPTGGGTATGTSILLTCNGVGVMGNATNENGSGHVFIFDPTSTGTYKDFEGQATYVTDDGYFAGMTFWGDYRSTTNALNYLRFQMGSGNIASGIFNLYGIT